MFIYQKKLQYPVKIANPNPALAKFILTQYGGPDGELGASLRYLSQRYSMPYPELKGLLTDIGTEELGHLEMVASIVHQLTRKMTPEEIKKAGFDAYFVDHTAGVYPQFASGTPWTAATMQVKGDVITDLSEDMAEGSQTVRDKFSVYGTYMHGIFDAEGVAATVVEALLAKKGLSPEDVKVIDYQAYKEQQYDLLADSIRENLDMDKVKEILERGI